MSASTLRELFVDQLKDVHDAEVRLTRALPKMAKAAHSQELRSAFQEHLKQTEAHVDRVKRVLDSIDEAPSRKTCKAILGLLEEGEELMKEGPENVRDAALIAAAQKVEHYEMATYGCLRTWAGLLGEDEASQLLQTTLDEEGETDHKLTEIAQSLNADALNGEDQDRPRGGGRAEPATPARRPRANGRSTSSRKRSSA